MHIPVIDRVVKMPAQWRLRFLQALTRWGVREEMLLVVIAGMIGLGGGVAAWIFEKVLGFVQTYYFLALSQRYELTTSRLYLLPFLPAAGGLAVIAVRRIFRMPDSKLHGLSALMYNLIRKAGVLRTTLGIETLLASIATLGSGGSTGPEAPIAIIGSSIGSLIGRLAGISRRNVPTLIGCGAAAGISAVFDAPIAGLLFSLEVLLRDFSVKTFSPIVISAVVATVTFQTITGEASGGMFASHITGEAYRFTFHEMPHFLLLGIVCGIVAVTFTKTMTAVEHTSEKLVKWVPAWLHPALGAFLSGVCGVILILLFKNDPYLGGAGGKFAAESYVPIFATGYPTIHRLLDPANYVNGAPAHLALSFLAAIFILKLLASAFTVGSGGSGGVFAPSLFVGAAAGAILGIVLHHFDPNVAPNSYALVGMGAVLAAAIQAPLMSIILLFELSRNYQVMLPAMLAAITATAIQQWMVRDSMYTLGLRHVGVRPGSPVGAGMLRRIGIDQLELESPKVISANSMVTELLAHSRDNNISDWVVLDDQERYLGLLTANDLRLVELQAEAAPLILAGDIVRTDIPPLCLIDSAEAAFAAFARFDVDYLPVFTQPPFTRGALKGLLARPTLMRRYYTEMNC